MSLPTIEIVQLTPDLAREFLACNVNNYRPANLRRVRELTGAMHRGEFSSVTPSNDAVTFAEDGTMTNGQHRCLAVIRSGVAVPVVVMRGGPITAADVMDTGVKRSAATVLTRHGYKNSAKLAGIVRAYAALQIGNAGPHAGSYSLTNIQILSFVGKYDEELQASIFYARRAHKVTGLPVAPGAAIHFAASVGDVDRAGEFYERLIDGIGLYPGNPIYALRTRMMRLTNQPHSIDRTFLGAIMIKAWNAWYDRRALNTLRWRGASAPDEPFPVVRPSGYIPIS